MKRTKLLPAIVLMLVLHQTTNAQSGSWAKAGNNLTGTEKLGSTNNQPLRFFTNNQQRMTLLQNGLFGIGTAAPKAPLHVIRGSVGVGVSPDVYTTLMLESAEHNHLTLLAPATKESGVLFNTNTFSTDGSLLYNTAVVPFGLEFKTNGFTDVDMVLSNKGHLGVGISSPKARLHVANGLSGALTPTFTPTVQVESPTDNFVNIAAPSTKMTGVLFGNNLNGQDGGIIYNSGETVRGLQFNTGGNNTRMVLTSNGRLGLNTKTPSGYLHIIHGEAHGIRMQVTPTSNYWAFQVIPGSSTKDLGFISDKYVVGFFDGNDGSYAHYSDGRLKKDIEKSPDLLDKVMQLDVKKYHVLQDKPDSKKHFGMIAQEVDKLFPEIVKHVKTNSMDVYAVDYSAYGVLAIKAIQEQQKKIETLEERIAKLEAALTKTAGKNNTSMMRNEAGFAANEAGNNALEQNQPNPFSQSTIIRYQLPQGSSGQINIYNMNGTLVKSQQTDNNIQTAVNASDLKSGTYTYTLSVDGNVIGSKKMVVVK